MNKDQVAGKVKDVAGRIERQAGEWTGDPKKQADGALKQAEGKVQNAWGNIRDASQKAAEKHNDKSVTKAEEPAGADNEVDEEVIVRSTPSGKLAF